VERDPNPPRKGCFWTIRKGKETKFIENLQKPIYNNKRTNYKHTDDDNDNDQDLDQNQTHLILTTATSEQPSSIYYDAYRIYPEIDLESTSCDTFSTHSEDHHHYSLFNSPPPTVTTTKPDWSLNYFS
jgi:hypothetical protein